MDFLTLLFSLSTLSFILSIFFPFFLLYYFLIRPKKSSSNRGTSEEIRILRAVNAIEGDKDSLNTVKKKYIVYGSLALVSFFMYLLLLIWNSSSWLSIGLLFIVALCIFSYKFLKHKNMYYLLNARVHNIQYKYPPGIQYAICMFFLIVIIVLTYNKFGYLFTMGLTSNSRFLSLILIWVLQIITLYYFVNGFELINCCYRDLDNNIHNIYQKSFLATYSKYIPTFKSLVKFFIGFCLIAFLIVFTYVFIALIFGGGITR